MKVFISSVRRGLEEERDALPGLLLAIGHEPLRFEDFSSQPIPSREACLRGVEAADVYVLLIGEHYGDPLPETGQSPTQEEYTVARRRGIPRLMFRKQAVTLDPAQDKFVKEIESYSVGLYRNSFASTADLQTKVVTALRDLPTASLEWRPLTQGVSVAWRAEWPELARNWQRIDSESILEIHAVPVKPQPISRRHLATLTTSIASRLRSTSAVTATSALESDVGDQAAWVTTSVGGRRSFSEPDRGGFVGCRIASTGQRSAWQRLPSDSMGVILDANDLARRIADSLRTLGAIEPLQDCDYAIAAALNMSMMTIEGNISDLGRRSSASGFAMQEREIQLIPDEAVTSAAFDSGADEVARTLSDLLLGEFRRARHR